MRVSFFLLNFYLQRLLGISKIITKSLSRYIIAVYGIFGDMWGDNIVFHRAPNPRLLSYLVLSLFGQKDPGPPIFNWSLPYIMPGNESVR